MNSIVTRFAPSPTGNLHLGGIRTALLNYIVVQQAKNKLPNSKFYLRIEDTDKERSKEEFIKDILEGLNWLNINYDAKPQIQSSNIKRHQEIAKQLLKNEKAFKCICSNEILDKKREFNKKNKINNKKLCETCEDDNMIQSSKDNYTVRIKVPTDGEIEFNDIVQGKISINNREIDNFILLRRDGTPTYMLSVVVDDFDMGVNFIIRGDDHLNNVFRQNLIYKAMEWKVPKYAHIPLIHGNDGKKLSKRHGAVSINDFRNDGYLKESIINNLILLGWSPNKIEKDEFIQINEIIKSFDINKISKSSSIFSYEKLNFFNNHYIKNKDESKYLIEYCKNNENLNIFIKNDKDKFIKIFEIYKKNLNFYKELENIAKIYFLNDNEIVFNNESKKYDDRLIKEFNHFIDKITNWNIDNLKKEITNFILIEKIKFSSLGVPLRNILINSSQGPGLHEIMYILGKKTSIERIKNYISKI
ncbi:MAG: glutamate--tRNA ligase [Alphaproteobacteria bacterium]